MTGSTRAPSQRWVLRAAAALASLLLAGGAEAELVIFASGEVLKVRAFSAGEETVRLELPAGGTLTVPLTRVDRIIEDEVEEPVPAVPEAPVEGLAALSLRYSPGDVAPTTPWGSEILAVAERRDLNPRLLAAVVAAESAFNPRAVSRKGARGLMQLMPGTGQRFGLTRSELFDPAKNLDAGARYLAWLIERFAGDLARVLAAYNAGEATVDRYGGVPPYRETRAYVRRIYGLLGLGGALPSGV